MIRIGVSAAVRLYREGLALILADAPDVEVCFVASSWHVAAALTSSHELDVLLLDIPIGEARPVVRQLAASAPRTRVVALSISEEQHELISWAETGIAGYVTRDDSTEELVDVVRRVTRDEMPCSPRAAATLLRHIASVAVDAPAPVQLTARELEILRLLELGLSNKEIGTELYIAVATVKNHVHNLLEKLQVSSRSEAVAIARHLGAKRTAIT